MASHRHARRWSRLAAWRSRAVRLARCTRGSAAAEFALTVPIVLLLCAGIVEFGGVYQVYNATNQIASQYALSWADCSDSPAGYCQTELNSYTSSNAIANTVPQLIASNLTLQMFQVQMNGSSPTVQYAYPASATLSPAQTSAAQSQFSSGQTGVIVTASYVHTLRFFSGIMSPYLGNALTPSYTVLQLKN